MSKIATKLLAEGKRDEDLMEVNIDAEGSPEMKTISSVIEDSQHHKAVVEEINGKWKKERLELKLGTVLMYHDFTTLHESTKRKVSGVESLQSRY